MMKGCQISQTDGKMAFVDLFFPLEHGEILKNLSSRWGQTVSSHNSTGTISNAGVLCIPGVVRCAFDLKSWGSLSNLPHGIY